jgi:hypothetical protein
MKHAVNRFSLAALAAVALYKAPAVAQQQARAQAIQVYGGDVTANLGVGAKYYVTTNLFWDLGIRYWYLDRVVSLEDTLLTTAGAGTA